MTATEWFLFVALPGLIAGFGVLFAETFIMRRKAELAAESAAGSAAESVDAQSSAAVDQLWRAARAAFDELQRVQLAAQSVGLAEISRAIQGEGGLVHLNKQEAKVFQDLVKSRQRSLAPEIQRTYGNTLVGTLRKIYGESFGVGVQSSEKLGDVVSRLDAPSFFRLMSDYDAGKMEEIANQGRH
jgi:hypothetical protein